MNRRKLLKLGSLATLTSTSNLASIASAEGIKGRNIVFIALDDLNDWIGCLGGHPDTRTPNLDRLAEKGLLFSNAHTPAPYCNPARSSILSGLYPASSGIYLGETLQTRLPTTATLTEHFMQYDYEVIGAGKIFHLEGNETESRWHDFTHFQRAAGEKRRNPPLHGISELSPGDTLDWGVVDMDEQEFADWAVADWAVGELNKPHNRSFFMGVGFFHPHLPWYVPRKYSERFPPDKITLPATSEHDLEDIPSYARGLASRTPFPLPDALSEHQRIVRHGQWRNAVSCYLAAVNFADTLVGRVVDALARSRYAQDTILIVWSDGGFHLGEKQHWRKFSLWERGTRSPLLFYAPGITRAGSRCVRPVSLTDLYPTLLDLAGLPKPGHKLDGHSLLTLMANPTAEWPHVALTTHLPNNHAVRSERWRYIRYHDGSEELYDHENDPMEWKNLAADAALRRIKQELAAHMPQQVAKLPRKRPPR